MQAGVSKVISLQHRTPFLSCGTVCYKIYATLPYVISNISKNKQKNVGLKGKRNKKYAVSLIIFKLQ
jgi:hypothetical protein